MNVVSLVQVQLGAITRPIKRATIQTIRLNSKHVLPLNYLTKRLTPKRPQQFRWQQFNKCMAIILQIVRAWLKWHHLKYWGRFGGDHLVCISYMRLIPNAIGPYFYVDHRGPFYLKLYAHLIDICPKMVTVKDWNICGRANFKDGQPLISKYILY